MTKIKSYASKDWIALAIIIKHNIKIFECQYKENKQHKKWRYKVLLYRLNLCFQRIKTIIVKLIQLHANNIVVTLKVRFCLYKITCYPHLLYYFFISTRSLFFYAFYVFLYIIIYILNIARAKKRQQSMKSEALSLETIIKKLDFLEKAVIILMECFKKKDLLSLASKLIEKIPILVLLKKIINDL